MPHIYKTKSNKNNSEIKLCVSADPKYSYAIIVNGKVYGYADTFKNAYILYNECAR